MKNTIQFLITSLICIGLGYWIFMFSNTVPRSETAGTEVMSSKVIVESSIVSGENSLRSDTYTESITVYTGDEPFHGVVRIWRDGKVVYYGSGIIDSDPSEEGLLLPNLSNANGPNPWAAVGSYVFNVEIFTCENVVSVGGECFLGDGSMKMHWTQPVIERGFREVFINNPEFEGGTPLETVNISYSINESYRVRLYNFGR